MVESRAVKVAVGTLVAVVGRQAVHVEVAGRVMITNQGIEDADLACI